jgi:hypothetical protein
LNTTTEPPKKGKKKSEPALPSSLSLRYQLAELPTSQHRAGLAGLVLMIDWLKRLPASKQEALCKLSRLDDTGATLEIDLAGLSRLFDVLYEASSEEQESAQLRKNKKGEKVEPLREETRTETDEKGKTKTKTVYFYPVTIPRGAFLPDLDPAAQNDKGPWVKLWRDMLWSIMRGVPATRKPFENRAERAQLTAELATASAARKVEISTELAELHAAIDKECADVWGELLRPETYSLELPSTYFLGAQAKTAELVPFYDKARYQFLLHFWPLVAQVYVPAVVGFDGKREFIGYAVSIPDIAQLQTFCEEFPSVLKSRGIDLSGYRPKESIVDVALESGLDLMRRFRDQLALKEGSSSIADTLLGIDVLHTEKQGNSIKLLGNSRVEPVLTMVNDYDNIKRTFWDHSFRKQRLLNLVAGRDWSFGFERLFRTLPKSQTIESNTFRHDAREVFQQEFSMSNEETAKLPNTLEGMVYKLVGDYLSQKLRGKYDLSWAQVQTDPIKQKDYEDKKQKLAKDAFFAVRSRSGQDFIDYFTATICSVSHYLPAEQFTKLSQSLFQETDKVRALTMLALSARG